VIFLIFFAFANVFYKVAQRWLRAF
jgi:hypothetical protein